MKAVVAAFNQEKALVGSFSVITNLRMQLFEALIREAWLKLSMLHHPDLNKDNPEEAQEKFMEIKEAYTTLINDEKRKAYNDKIGFYHSDPPPDFKREWTFKGEMERSGAASYHVMWSEEAIRKLMSSDKLRDVSADHYLNGHIAIMFLISSDELA